ncbi:alanine racemase [Massilia sp. CF038]|uniref:alanine racemase n=1 Tax=Massilia sp. CF038 TaxID=1881045 RepID=UPI000915174C|nr:alanine racemase [Massilia sp. CF038]SHH12177.1 D-serine deaminase, pyridoxal phosphate-dependent [Massilia sp. CF038]
MKRRTMVAALGAGLVGAGALALHPGQRGAPHAPYFARMAAALRAAGIATPTMVIDRDALHNNAAQVTRNIAGRMQLRLVAKSLPCLPLLDDLAASMRTDRLMVFNLPYLQQLAEQRPAFDLLLGKPLPVAAAAAFYQNLKTATFNPSTKLQWLIDGPQRLAQYRDLARQRHQAMRVNIELDVGLHRGGVADSSALQQMLAIFKSEPLLEWSGMMGYDAHIAKLPDLPGVRSGAFEHATSVYRDWTATATHALHAGATPADLTLNAGGSPTYRLHDGSKTPNEVALGSALVKPTDFDLDSLHDLAPAAFIATPVIKAPPEFLMPNGVEWLGSLARMWDANQRRVYFIYGGNWLANPVSPEGLAPSGLYGPSSNQQAMLGSGAQNLQMDDFIFFRPRQSESVLQQFGDIVVMEAGRITQRWPVLPAMP